MRREGLPHAKDRSRTEELRQQASAPMRGVRRTGQNIFDLRRHRAHRVLHALRRRWRGALLSFLGPTTRQFRPASCPAAAIAAHMHIIRATGAARVCDSRDWRRLSQAGASLALLLRVTCSAQCVQRGGPHGKQALRVASSIFWHAVNTERQQPTVPAAARDARFACFLVGGKATGI